MSEKFKHFILNNWHGSEGTLTDALDSLNEIISSCYDLGEERVATCAVHFEDETTGASMSLFTTDGKPKIQFEFNDSTSEFFNAVFESTGLTYDQLPTLDDNDIALVKEMFSDDYRMRKQNLTFVNFPSAGGFFLSVHLDSIDENTVDLIAYLLSQYSSLINSKNNICEKS